MKKLLALLLVVATLFCVAACGDKEDNNTTTTTAQNSTTTTTAQDNTTTANGEQTTTGVVEGETTTLPAEGETTTLPAEGETTTTKNDTPTTTKPLKGINGVDYDNKANQDKVVNSVFTASNGGLQMKADGWKTYTLNTQLSMVPTGYNNDGFTNAVCIAVYDADSADVFANKTEKDFEDVLLGDITTFEKITVDGYPAYYAVIPNQMYCYVVNTPNHKYFINFLQAVEPYGSPIEATAKAMMATVEIYK